MTSQCLTRCEGCPHGLAKMVGERGDPRSPLVIVGESPGVMEIKVGQPFVGPSGKVLAASLEGFDIEPYYVNAFQCFPGTKQKDPNKVIDATHLCQKRLHALITAYPRKAILALGNPAIWGTTEDYSLKVTQVRGKIFQNPKLCEHGIVAATHPAFLLRGGGVLRQFQMDVDLACQLAKGNLQSREYIVPKFYVAKDSNSIDWLARQIARQKFVAADIETGGFNGFDHQRDRILCIGFCWDPKEVWVVPEHLVMDLHKVFAAKNTKFIWHNGKFDTKFLWDYGITGARVDEDTMLLSYCLDENGSIHDLEQVSGDLLGAPDWKFMIKPYLVKGKTYDTIPRPILHDYMSRDISSTLQVFRILRRKVASDPKLELAYTKTLIPYSAYAARIEMRGMNPNLKQAKINDYKKQRFADRLERALNKVAIRTGYGPFNPRSPVQVGSFLYDHLKLRDPRKPTKRPTSTDEKTLVSLQKHIAVKILLKYREVAKGLSTYVKPYLVPPTDTDTLIGRDGRIHCTYLIHGTTTGRPASRNPNLLNIPREPALRDQFMAPEGRMYAEIDVSQAELRVLTEFSGDPVLIQIYSSKGMSIHDVTRMEMYGDPKLYSQEELRQYMQRFSADSLKRVIGEQKMRAKTVNFGIVYGRTAPSIADEFKTSTLEAQEWINKWFRKYAGAAQFIQACRMAPVKGKNLVTPFGRKRRFQLVNPEKLNDIQNQAANFPEQSTASDIVVHVGLQIEKYAEEKYDAYIVNSVYDSILFELPDNPEMALELATDVLVLLKQVPRQWGMKKVPFTGDLKIGKCWGSLKEVEEFPPHLQERIDGA